MTNQSPQQLGHRMTQCEVITNIKDLRETITNKLKYRCENQHSQQANRQDRVSERFQREIARLTVLLQRTERLVLRTSATNSQKLGELNNLVNSLKIGISTLFDASPNIELSRQIRLTVEQEIISNENPLIARFIARRFSYAWHSPSTPLKVIHGLLFSFFIIFGGLFTLAMFQYAAYRSHISVLNYPTLKEITEAQRGELARKTKELNSEIISKRKAIYKPNQDVHSRGAITTNEPLITGASQDSLIRGELLMLEDEKKVLDEKKIELSQNLLRNKPSQAQEFMAHFFDIGISKTLSQILWVAAAGTLGSIISILIRVIDEFNNKEYQDRLTPFFLGFFKPVIGASFGVLFLAIYNAEFVDIPFVTRTSPASSVITPQAPIEGNSSSSTVDARESDSGFMNSDQDSGRLNATSQTGLGLILNKNLEVEKERKEAFFLFAIAFVVGFSERLAKDTIGRIDGSNSTTDKANSDTHLTRIVIIRASKPRSTGTTHSKRSPSNSHDAELKQVESDRDQRRTFSEERRNNEDE
ncbi:MAG: hypothetical protein NW220_07565 [Leptolyngbyaceae cyanobacterium bins.349]|nr:hypothetical protein [Leptolyngbyaceae cyanobacterium bins.349]